MYEIDASNILDQTTSLLDLIDNDLHIFNDETHEPSVYQHSHYYQSSDISNVLKTKSHNFILLSLNCQSLQAKFEQIKGYIKSLTENNCTISAICLQETWLSDESDLSLLHLEGYNLISRGKSCSAHGGVAIYLHESFQYKIVSLINESHSWDSQFVEVSLQSDLVAPVIDRQKLLIGNIYRPPRQTVEDIGEFKNEFYNIIENLQNYKHVILTGDFNIDLLKFKENAHISDFLDTMISYSYFPKITMPTRLTHKKGTLIDNFFVKLSDNFSQTTSGIILSNISDHLPYILSLDYLFTKFRAKNMKVKISKISPNAIENFKIDLANQNLEHKLRNLDNLDANSSYEILHNTLSFLINKHFPVKYANFNKYKHKRNDWITMGILRSIAFRDKLYVKLKSTSEQNPQYNTLRENLKTYNKILKKSIQTAKKLYYAKRFDDFKYDIKNTWNTINDIINRKNNKSNPPEGFLINNVMEHDQQKIAHEFNKYFVQIGPKLADDIQIPHNKCFKDYLITPANSDFYFYSVNENDVIKAIDSLKSKSSCGIDRLSSKLLKALKSELACPIAQIFNKCIADGSFPDKLKTAKVLPIYKKQEKFMLQNYRPISILPSVSKVFEKLMHCQISKYFNDSQLHFPGQYGFRSFHSTELAVLEIVERVITQMDKKMIPINIYLDLSKAFDTLDHEILLYKLKYYGFQNNSLNLMKSYLSNRTQYVELNDTSSDLMHIKVGVPQGSILGPLLFIIYMNDLVNATDCFYPVVYADDTTLTATLNAFGNNTSLSINNNLHAISDWLKLNKLSLNSTKTKAMIFHTHQKVIHQYPNLNIDGNKIEFVDHFNLLGIVIDRNLNFVPHINVISKKISKTAGIINKLKNTIPADALINIYNTLVLSYINYGLLIWGGKGHKIFKLQKKVIRNMTRSQYNAHTSGLFKRLKLLKYEDLCALHDLKFCFRVEHGNLPDFFMKLTRSVRVSSHNYLTRQNDALIPPQIKHEFARHSIAFRYPHMYNKMPPNIKDKIHTHSFEGFKNYFKITTINSYSNQCNIQNCYTCNLNSVS